MRGASEGEQKAVLVESNGAVLFARPWGALVNRSEELFQLVKIITAALLVLEALCRQLGYGRLYIPRVIPHAALVLAVDVKMVVARQPEDASAVAGFRFHLDSDALIDVISLHFHLAANLGYGRLTFDPDKDAQPLDAHARLADDVLADDRERPVGAHSVVMAERPELLDLAGCGCHIRLVPGEGVVAPLADLHVSEVNCDDLAYGRLDFPESPRASHIV